MNCLTEIQVQCRVHCSLPAGHRARARSQAVQRVHCSQRQESHAQHTVRGCTKVTGLLVAQQLVCAQLAGASEAVSGVADAGSSTLPLALGGGAAIAALSAALISTDPQKRCESMLFAARVVALEICVIHALQALQFGSVKNWAASQVSTHCLL